MSELVNELVKLQIFYKTTPTNLTIFFMKIENHNRKTIGASFFLKKF